VLLALKTLELRARRDALVVFFLGFFTMLTNFFFSQSLLTAAAMLVACWGCSRPWSTPTCRWASRRCARPRARRTDGAAGRAGHAGAVHAVPAPRAAVGHAGRRHGRPQRPVGQMQVGTIASLALDDSMAMRMRFEGPPPPQSICTSAARCCPPLTAANGGVLRSRLSGAAAGRKPDLQVVARRCATRSRWSPTTALAADAWTRPGKPAPGAGDMA
jgi:hypothetical protein